MLGLGNILTKGGALLGFPNKYSFNFDGSNDYLDIGTNSGVSFTGTQPFTISMWVNLDSVALMALCYKRSGTNGYIFQVHSDGTLELSTGTGSALEASRTSTTISADEWTHIAVVRTASAGKALFYKNGSLMTINSLKDPDHASMSDNSTIPLSIGEHGGSRYFNGKIDEFSMFDAELSAGDIAKLGSKPLNLSKASTYATDRTANLKLWLRAGDKVLPEEDKSIARSDFHLDFDGSDDYVSIADSDDLSFGDSSNDLPFSGTAWINPVDATNFQILFKDTEWQFYLNSSDKLALFFEDESSGAYEYAVDSGSAISQNVWTHVAFTYNGVGGASANAGMKLYVNGIESSYTLGDSGDYDAMQNSANAVTIGKQGSNYSDGKISNVAIHKTTLDAQTIKQFAKSRYTPMRDNRFSVVDFDGVNDFIDIPDNNALDAGSGDMTITFWYNPLSMSANMEIIDKYDTSSNKGYRVRHHNGTSKVWFNINDGADSDGYYSYIDVELSYGQWYHVTIIWDNSEQQATYYINGVNYGRAFSTSLRSIGDTSNSVPLRFGGTQAGGSDYKGSISSIAIYNVARTTEEDYACYQKGITHNPSADTGLVGLWRMGDDTSKAYPTIADSSSNSNDGTMSNMASDDIVQQMVAGYDMGAFESTGQEVGGDTLAGVGIFDTDTTSSWSAVNTSISYNSSGFMRSVFSGTLEGGVHGGTVLTVGNNYNVTFKAKSDRSVKITSIGDYLTVGDTVLNPTLTTSFQNYEFNISPTQTTFRIYMASGSSAGDFLDLKDIRLKEVLQSADLSDTYPAIIDVNEPVAGAELWDADASTFDSGTHSWVKYGNNTITNDSGALKVTYVDNALGAYVWLKDASDISTDLTVGKTYKLTFDAKVNSGSSVNPTVSAYEPFVTVTETSFTTKSLIFTSTHATSNYFDLRNMGSGEIIWIDNLSLKEVQGNVGTMTNQDSADLVYSSVLPDQSFLTGVNSAYNFIDLDGTDACIKNDSFTGHQSNTGTLSGWFNFDDVSTQQRFLGVGGTTGAGATRLIEVDGGNVFFIGYGSANVQDWDSGASVEANNWYHLALTWNGTSAVIYVNGTAYSQTLSGLVTPTGTKIQIGGAVWDGNDKINGKASGVGVWNKTLSSTEISAIYTAGRHTNLLDSYSDNLKAYFAFGALDATSGLADTDSTIYDRSGNSVHGTTSGTATGDLKSPPNATPNGYSKNETNRLTTTP